MADPAAPTASISEAARAATRARTRLVLSAAADGAAGGALAGAGLALAAAAAVRFAVLVQPPAWLLAVPALAAGFGAARAALRPVPMDRAALALDAAAGTDEAFVSALTARDASTEIRDLAAKFALARCAVSDVPRRMPFRTPAVLAAAVLATGAAAALVLVGSAAAEPVPPSRGDVELPAAPGPSPGAAASPESRATTLAAALRARTAPSPGLAEAVQRDLPAVADESLRALAEALANGGSDEARAALDALARGDRAAAVRALLDALGTFAHAGDLAGGGIPSGPPPASRAPAPAGETWPLRYDRTIRRWQDLRTEETR